MFFSIFCTGDDKKEREKDILQSEMIPMERKNLTFWNKLFELQYKMLFNNQENVAGHMYASEPLDWLSLKRGVAYWISANSNVSMIFFFPFSICYVSEWSFNFCFLLLQAQIHFIGNIVTWLSGTIGLVVYVGLFLVYLLRRQRACYDLPEDAWNKYCIVGEVSRIILTFSLKFKKLLDHNQSKGVKLIL